MNPSSCASALIFLATLAAAPAADLNIPRAGIADGEPETMMKRYWLERVDAATRQWEENYERLETPEEIARYQERQLDIIRKALGEFPERTPLKPRVTGRVTREGYTVEKVIFESRPWHHVSALLFLPDPRKFKAPHPGVLVPCGHAATAKAHDEYQSMGALLALNGMAALVFDPIDQGERSYFLGPNDDPELWGTKAHSTFGVGAILLGQNTATYMIWDGMRALDYLESRPEVDGGRLGCTGNSGGGTQTAYLAALDERIRASAISCWVCGFPALLHTIGPQDAEQNIFGLVSAGVDHGDFIMARAPVPTLICAATQDFFDIGGTWDVFRQAKRLYTRLGFPERVSLMENDEKHNYNVTQREAVARWMSRWLLDREQVIKAPPLVLLNREEVQCTIDGRIMNLPGATSIHDLAQSQENELAPARAKRWKQGNREDLLDEVRRVAVIRPLRELPVPAIESFGQVERSGYRIEKVVLRPETGIWLPALKIVPSRRTARVVLHVHEDGKLAESAPGGELERLAQAGDTILAVDLRGVGQTRPTSPNPPNMHLGESKEVRLAYLLGRSYVGARAEDVMVCARYAASLAPSGSDGGVHLIAVGKVGVPALHAAALESSLFASVRIIRTLISWSNLIKARRHQDQLVNSVHGALRHYDLPNLAESLGSKLELIEPQDARGRTLRSGY